MSDSLWPHGFYSPWNSPGQNTGVGSLSLLQGIFPTQGLNPGLLHRRRILYQLSHQGSPRILEWVAYPFSKWLFPTQESNQRIFINPPKVSSMWIFRSYNTVRKASQYWRKYSFSRRLPFYRSYVRSDPLSSVCSQLAPYSTEHSHYQKGIRYIF